MSQIQNFGSGLYQPMYVYDEDTSWLYSPRFYWTYRQRGKDTFSWQFAAWTELWPCAAYQGGDPSQSPYVMGQDNNDGAQFEPPDALYGGYYRPYYFRGYCYDNNSNPVGGARVAAYLTAGDVFAGSSYTRSDGFYELGVAATGAYYLVASTNTVVGGTVNTLQPTL